MVCERFGRTEGRLFAAELVRLVSDPLHQAVEVLETVEVDDQPALALPAPDEDLDPRSEMLGESAFKVIQLCA